MKAPCKTYGSGLGAFRRILLPLMLTALLAGCIDVDAIHEDASRELKVKWAEFSYRIPFASGRGAMDPSARADLDSFLAKERVGRPDRVYVASQPVLADEARDRLEMKREQAVFAHLTKLRLAPGVMRGTPKKFSAGSGGKGAITVVVRRPLVVTPECPDWKNMFSGVEIQADQEHFGCTNAIALGAMVADPNDLVEGREPGPFNGEALSLSMRAYLADRTKALKKVSTKK